MVRAGPVTRNKEKVTISTLKNSAGKPTNSPQENQIVRNLYAQTYSLDKNPSQEDIDSFLNSVELPQVNTDQTKTMDLPFTEKELSTALNLMPSHKAPGPDGFPAEFYKHFWSILAPLLKRPVTEIKQKSRFPTHMKIAIISLLPKPNKDPTLPSSFRPISLINAHTKIISKGLAHRLEKVIRHIMHPDQTGFLKGRFASR